MTNYKEHLQNITTFIFDYDGVISDGTLIVIEDKEALRTGNVKDGYALQLAVKKGYNVAIISGGRSNAMRTRFKSLNIKDVFLGVENKKKVFYEYLMSKGLKPEQVMYMGDDIPDYEVMKEAGLPTCPADACAEIKSVAKYISDFEGGKGCVRDIIEQTMKLQGKWMNKDGLDW